MWYIGNFIHRPQERSPTLSSPKRRASARWYNASQQPRCFSQDLLEPFPNFDCPEDSNTARSLLYHPIILSGMSKFVLDHKLCYFEFGHVWLQRGFSFSPHFELSDFDDIFSACFFHDSLSYISVRN